MNVRTVARGVALVTVVGAGITMLRELQSWEWHRAVIAGVFMLVAEVALVASLILDKIGRLESASAPSAERADRFADRLGATRPMGRDQFAWLRDPSRTNVFIPLLMGAGVVMSGLAWLVERIAGRTARGTAERRLAHRLHQMLPEPAPFVAPVAQSDHPALLPLLAPRRRP